MTEDIATRPTKKEPDEDLQEKMSWIEHIPRMVSNMKAFLVFNRRLEQESHRKFLLLNTLTMEKRDRVNMQKVGSTEPDVGTRA